MNQPILVPLCRVVAAVGAPLDVGQSSLGERRMIPILGGTVEGARLSGKVLSGGIDYQLIRDEGLTEIHARYVIETASGARIYVENTGLRRGPPEVIAKLRRGEEVDASLIYFRASPRFETAAPEYSWLMRSLFLCSGERKPSAVNLDFFEVT
jgi:Protein of unknown function (DUF3237)